MKKLLALILLTPFIFTGVAVASTYSNIYCYPTGTYWQKQIGAYPDYYAVNNAKFLLKYGPGTKSCE